jgi:vacuolar protein sorting-associated protein 72
MKMETRRYTQGELIALALDTEEGNIVEHRDYLKIEAEKRKRARVVRTTITGPLLRWISKKEEIKVAVPPTPAPPVFSYPSSLSLYKGAGGTSGHLFSPMAYSYTTGATQYAMNVASQPRVAGNPSASPQPIMTTTQFHAYQRYMDPTYSAFPMWPPAHPSQPQASTSTIPTPLATSATGPVPGNSMPGIVQQPSEPETRLEAVTKNYVVHELAQQKNTPKPSWMDTMESMFGDHVKWDEVKVFVGKNRPLCEYS